MNGEQVCKFGVSLSLLSYWSLEVQHGTHGKNSQEDLNKWIVLIKMVVGYTNIVKTTETELAARGQDHTAVLTGQVSTQNRPRHGRPKKLSGTCSAFISRGWGWGVSLSSCLDPAAHCINWSASGTCRELLGQVLKYKKMGSSYEKKNIYRSKDWIHYYFIFVYILCHIVIKPTFIWRKFVYALLIYFIT